MEDGGGKRSSEPIGSGAATGAVDLTKAVFDSGLKLLMTTGLPEPRARSMIGKWRSQYGDGATLAVISRAEIVRPEVPIEWITEGLKAERNRSNGQPIQPLTRGTTLDAIRGAIDATGGAEGGGSPAEGAGDWGAWDMPDPMLALGHVER
ncbi:hypothetical protein ATM17_12775 [Sphingopyxis macrogoltabida]|uniref:Uncharacterized protein n=2 Tax=Sphingopyxis macrogoltabida TaxID=33050 RepID=A0AAC8Z0W3_SPHMC|nr:hypothetical protein ATM17_12775 [Sphingopyxis macrogoltabida]